MQNLKKKNKVNGEIRDWDWDEIERMGLGVLSLTPYFLYNLSFREFNNCVEGYMINQEKKERIRWEQIRWQTTVLVNYSGNVRKGKIIKPTDLIKFEWDTPDITTEDLKKIDDIFPKYISE